MFEQFPAAQDWERVSGEASGGYYRRTAAQHGAPGSLRGSWRPDPHSTPERSGDAERDGSQSRVTAFRDPCVAAAYRFRPPYPAETIAFLRGLLPAGLPVVLDAGCGTGNLARPLAPLVERVDALDVSEAMIAEGLRLPGGEHPHLHWIVGRAEDAALRPPYGLVTAGSSLHWMDWDLVLPRFRQLLVPGGLLAIAGARPETPPWRDELRRLRREREWRSGPRRRSMIAELVHRGRFALRGEHVTAPAAWTIPLDEYIEGLHAHSGLARSRMTPAAAERFDAEVRRLAEPYSQDGMLTLSVRGWVVWGEPR